MPPYVILQFSILLAIAGFVVYWRFESSARFERHRQAEEQSLKAMRGIQATALTLKAEVEDLREICRDLASRPSPSAAIGMPGAKRTQAIRMLRKGESPENIAAALHVPRSHVQMLEKLRAMAGTEPVGVEGSSRSSATGRSPVVTPAPDPGVPSPGKANPLRRRFTATA